MSSSLPSVDTKDNVFVVKLKDKGTGEPNIESFGEQLVRLVDELELQKLELDLSEVEGITSVGLANFLTLYKKLKCVGGHLTVKNVDDLAYQVFRNTQLHKIFDIHRKQADNQVPDEPLMPPIDANLAGWTELYPAEEQVGLEIVAV